jgi:hypothetical protein
MALPTNHKWTEQQLHTYSPSVGASPVAAYVRAPARGKIIKVGCVLGGTLTGDATVTVAIGSTNVSPTFTLTASGSAGGTIYTSVPTGSQYCNEDDVISFTSASGSGSSIPGNFFAVMDKAGV